MLWHIGMLCVWAVVARKLKDNQWINEFPLWDSKLKNVAKIENPIWWPVGNFYVLHVLSKIQDKLSTPSSLQAVEFLRGKARSLVYIMKSILIQLRSGELHSFMWANSSGLGDVPSSSSLRRMSAMTCWWLDHIGQQVTAQSALWNPAVYTEDRSAASW